VLDLESVEVGRANNAVVHALHNVLYILLVRKELADELPERAGMLIGIKVGRERGYPQNLTQYFMFNRVKRAWIYYNPLKDVTLGDTLASNESRLLGRVFELL
jgi:hypothetical protein